MNRKQHYNAPSLESYNCLAEQGFAVSSAEGGFTLGDGTGFTDENVDW
jgi:hypothetical protein